jgi:acyl carrier protein
MKIHSMLDNCGVQSSGPESDFFFAEEQFMTVSPDIRMQLLERLSKASENAISPGEISETTSLREDLKLDSLELVTLVFDLQDELGVVIEDEELPLIITVGNLLQVVGAKLEPTQEISEKPV